MKASTDGRAPDRQPHHRAVASGKNSPHEDSRTVGPAELQRLQRGAGNRAVAGMLATRRGAPPPAHRTPRATAPQAPPGSGHDRTAIPASAGTPAPTTGTELPERSPQLQRLVPGSHAPARRGGPNTDPKFTALKRDVTSKQAQAGKHPPAKTESAASQAAAKPPQDDKEAQGKTANAEKMNAAKPGEFDKAAFIRAVNDAIAAQAPKNLDEADKFGDSGKADAVKGQVQGKVGAGKKASAGQIESTTKAPPDTSKAKEKQVTPLKPDQPPPTPGAPDAAKAVPDKAPPAATDFSAGPKQVDQQMAGAHVTEEQLAKSNEPEFQGALKDKKEGERHAATAPGQVRGKEAATLSGAKGKAAQAGATAMTALATDRKQAGAQVAKGKEGAKGKDESKRTEVTAKLQKVFDATKKDVEDILSGLDKKVDEKFTRDEKAARDAFTAEHKRKMDDYKDKRYSGFTGKLRWVKDKFAGLPKEADQIFVEARKGYVDRMQQVISGIADVIGADLTKAKQRIATGRTQLQAEVKSLGPGLAAIGKQAAAEFSGKFDELTESVDAKGKELVDTLATKYNDALKSVDDEIAAEKEKNKGLIAKAVDAVKGVIDTILKLKDLLLGILAKAAQAVMAIIKDPIGFLGKLVSALGAGLKAFIANIAGHLKKGLVGWLMGAMSGAGLELPAKFDLRGIIMMIGSLLGLTWAAIRGRVISRGVPAQAMETVEKSAPVAQKLQSEGIGGIWEQIKEKVGDLKENLFSKISEYLIPTVLIAGITWIISLLNPASAFIKACKMIIDIVTFIVERGAQIVQFVNAVLDAVIAIAGGGAGGVPALIENALALSIPVLIGALAAILGIGGIADKVKKFFQSLSKPVMKAVDWVVGKIVKFGKKIWAKLKSKFSKRDKEKEGKEGKSKEDKNPRLRELVAADVNAALPDGVTDDKVQPALHAIMSNRGKQGLDILEARKGSGPGQFNIYMSASPTTLVRPVKVEPSDPLVRDMINGQRYPEATFSVPKDIWISGKVTLPVSGEKAGYGATHAIGTLHTATRVTAFDKTSSGNDKHAEELIVDDVRSNWNSYVGRREDEAVDSAMPKANLVVKVTRSPCGRCAPQLGKLREFAKGEHQWDLTVEVRAIGLYHGETVDPETGEEIKGTGAKGQTVTTGPGVGKEGLLRLKQWGIEVKVLSPTDPTIKTELAKLPPQDQVKAIEKIADWNDKLRQAALEIKKVPVIEHKF